MRTASPPTGRKMADGPPRALLLRPVRPGEKRSTPPLAGLSSASARFEFSKKFAAILTQRPPADGEGEPSSQDRPSQAGEEASGRGELPFKPPQAPKLNLNRPDLLTRPMVPECEPLGEQEGSVLINQSAVLPPAPLATSSLLDWSALDSDPLLEPDEELQEGSGDQTADMSIISSKIARAQSPRQDRRAAPTTAVTTVFIKRSEVEEGTIAPVGRQFYPPSGHPANILRLTSRGRLSCHGFERRDGSGRARARFASVHISPG